MTITWRRGCDSRDIIRRAREGRAVSWSKSFGFLPSKSVCLSRQELGRVGTLNCGGRGVDEYICASHNSRHMLKLPSRWSIILLYQSRTLPHRPYNTRSLPLTREELSQKLDDQIRRRYPTIPPAVVEEVVRARRGIWGGLLGRQSALDYPSSSCD
jgi:hypothetical protein